MSRYKQTARQTTGGKAPRKALATKAAKMCVTKTQRKMREVVEEVDNASSHDEGEIQGNRCDDSYFGGFRISDLESVNSDRLGLSLCMKRMYNKAQEEYKFYKEIKDIEAITNDIHTRKQYSPCSKLERILEPRKSNSAECQKDNICAIR